MKKHLILIVVILIITGCKPAERIIEKEKIVYQTKYNNKIQLDSIHLLDSVFIHSKNDTIIKEKWRTEYRIKLRIDTLKIVDSTYVEIPVIVHVPKIEYRQNGLQKTTSRIGIITLLLLFGYGIFRLIKWKLIKL